MPEEYRPNMPPKVPENTQIFSMPFWSNPAPFSATRLTVLIALAKPTLPSPNNITKTVTNYHGSTIPIFSKGKHKRFKRNAMRSTLEAYWLVNPD